MWDIINIPPCKHNVFVVPHGITWPNRKHPSWGQTNSHIGVGNRLWYFRHASGEIYVISQALAQFISINRSILLSYAHDDVTTGSWFVGLDVKYIDDTKFCCSSWASGAICAGV
ncbi:Hydroxyproline O-galactosyltransferase HPGT1 [Vitis vinifera]|uniref:Hydroxyproline O-galactosyltransferase HPGT1 n=1 Tax=Vitis vinifera TaxID=29760 RepID=A0A438J5R0_VITVI|nr:Hydroxyproline O-galactosyltransferase HPGT1 [Vitis vinifera]